MKLHSLFCLAASIGAIAATINGPAPYGLPHSSSSRSPCSGNTADDRSKWCDYSLDTDYYSVVPDTGVTREYHFELSDVTVAPDGYSRPAMAVNGAIPGPTIYADWGDTVVVHVTNSLTSSKNGSAIHFHGVRQNNTNQMDGVASITQCPTAPGKTITYTWRASQYGSSWYHAHVGLQTWEGVYGGIVINGPATADYDEDKGILFISDWTHQTADELWYTAQITGPLTMDTGLINGTNVYTSSNVTTGHRFNTSFTAGTSYRFRLVNQAIDTFFKFSIDNHTFTVIANDFVPIQPYNATMLSIGIGERYDIIVTADQESIAENFWMRAIPQASCSSNSNADNIMGIVYYGDSPSTPTTTGYSYTDNCNDEALSNLVPYLSENVSSAFYNEIEVVTLGRNSNNFFRWYLNGTSILVDWSNPTLLQVYDNVTTFSNTSNVITVPNTNEWVYVIIESTNSVAHPIHLHGHDFYILAQGTGNFTSSSLGSLNNPPRRDTAMLPASGYLAIAFLTNNPGVWLMHCHIGWHQSEGFSLQFIEQYSKISSLVDFTSLNSTCSDWKSYVAAQSLVDIMSGI